MRRILRRGVSDGLFGDINVPFTTVTYFWSRDNNRPVINYYVTAIVHCDRKEENSWAEQYLSRQTQ